MSALYGSLKALRELPTPNIVFWSPVVATCVSYSLACTSRMSFLDFVLLVLQNLFELPTKDNSLTCRVINILLLYVTMFQALENSALFFFIMPFLIGGFGNWLIPLFVTTPDMSFPRINNFSFWIIMPASIFLVQSIKSRGTRSRWTI